MIERGDMIGVHEPFSDLAGLGETDVDGLTFRSAASLLAWLARQAPDVDVFLKDTTGRRHEAVLADFRDLSGYQVYACGAPAMIDAAKRDFTTLRNLPEEEFYADSFTYAAQTEAAS